VSPTIEFTSRAGGQIALQCYGGGGFVLDDKGSVLYGVSLDQDRNVTDSDRDSYTLSVRKRGWILKKWQIGIFRNRKALVDPGEGTVIASETSVVNLAGELDKTIRRMRAQSNPEAGPLSRWANQIQLLLTDSNRAYFVIAGQPGSGIQPQSSQLPVGSVMTIRWPRSKLSVRLESIGGASRLVFLPPFRQSSPLPPEDAPAPAVTKLEIEAAPAPGDKAFLLPVSALTAPHAEASLVNGLFQPQSDQTAVDVAQVPAVTSSFDAVIEPYHFYLDTIQDVPASWYSRKGGAGLPLFIPLLVIWLGYLCCLAQIALLYDDTVEPRALVALLGISLAAWVVLCARVGLAFRYASNPGTVDSLAINGLTLSLVAMAFLPAFVLVLTFLSAVKRQEAENLGWRRLLPAFNLSCLGRHSGACMAYVAHSSPCRQTSRPCRRVSFFFPSRARSAEGPCYPVFAIVWFVSCVWLWRKARRTSRQSLEDRLCKP
jgi:hypothetical protein